MTREKIFFFNFFGFFGPWLFSHCVHASAVLSHSFAVSVSFHFSLNHLPLFLICISIFSYLYLYLPFYLNLIRRSFFFFSFNPFFLSFFSLKNDITASFVSPSFSIAVCFCFLYQAV
jgi:hypothetical protein